MVEEGILYMWKVLNVTMLQCYNVTKCTSPSSARAASPLLLTIFDRLIA